ncbi:unnamed protein product [Lymnaea stagnalis]|uniref:Uncharacterized protein n=1 Tax=Lymnaea stagnalis TaxID=6523 RepID=A0AAV2H9U7_LYMST
MVKAESSCIMLEREQQQQWYKKCFDEISNQVVQVLLAHKLIQEEAVLTSQVYV